MALSPLQGAACLGCAADTYVLQESPAEGFSGRLAGFCAFRRVNGLQHSVDQHEVTPNVVCKGMTVPSPGCTAVTG